MAAYLAPDQIGGQAYLAPDSPPAGTTINCTVGGVVVSGLNATVTQSGSTTISANRGAVTVAGVTATIINGNIAHTFVIGNTEVFMVSPRGTMWQPPAR